MNDNYVPLVDFIREHSLNYSKIYQLTLKGIIKSKRIKNRIYIEKSSALIFSKTFKKKTVL